MSLRREKCRALTQNCNNLRRAIEGDMENLRFELCATGLISIDVRDKKQAGDIVSQVEHRLAVDETVWDKLIEVLRRSDNESNQNLSEKLSEQLRSETGQRSVCSGKVSAGDLTAREFRS